MPPREHAKEIAPGPVGLEPGANPAIRPGGERESRNEKLPPVNRGKDLSVGEVVVQKVPHTPPQSNHHAPNLFGREIEHLSCGPLPILVGTLLRGRNR